MANSLLDFVMSLVRDPDAAARYAADPAQAIADADLTDVTSADVQNLIPMVSESLSMVAPSLGLDAFGAELASNVWTSGAAATAFDAFADQVAESAVMDTYTVVTDIVDQPDPGLDDLSGRELDVFSGADLIDTAESLPLDEPAIQSSVQVQDDVATDPGLADDWVPPVADPHSGDHTPGLDIFD